MHDDCIYNLGLRAEGFIGDCIFCSSESCRINKSLFHGSFSLNACKSLESVVPDGLGWLLYISWSLFCLPISPFYTV